MQIHSENNCLVGYGCMLSYGLISRCMIIQEKSDYYQVDVLDSRPCRAHVIPCRRVRDARPSGCAAHSRDLSVKAWARLRFLSSDAFHVFATCCPTIESALAHAVKPFPLFDHLHRARCNSSATSHSARSATQPRLRALRAEIALLFRYGGHARCCTSSGTRRRARFQEQLATHSR